MEKGRREKLSYCCWVSEIVFRFRLAREKRVPDVWQTLPDRRPFVANSKMCLERMCASLFCITRDL